MGKTSKVHPKDKKFDDIKIVQINSNSNSNVVLQNRVCNVVQVVVFVVALASVTNILFLAHNTKSGKFARSFFWAPCVIKNVTNHPFIQFLYYD